MTFENNITLRKISYYLVMVVLLLVIIFLAMSAGYVATMFKLFIYNGTFYHDPFWDVKEEMMTQGLVSACFAILLYIFMYSKIMAMFDKILFNKKEYTKFINKMKGGNKK